MRKPKVGEKLWIVSGSRRNILNEKASGEFCTVISSGRKYFKCLVKSGGWGRNITFYLKTWREKTKYSPDYIIYESKQVWEDKVESRRYRDIFWEKFQYGETTNILCSN